MRKKIKLTPEQEAHFRRLDAKREEFLFQKKMKEMRGPDGKPPQAFNWTKYNQDQAEKVKEQERVHKLALTIVNTGFRSLALHFHPDKSTGSAEAMQRLNAARRHLRGLMK